MQRSLKFGIIILSFLLLIVLLIYPVPTVVVCNIQEKPCIIIPMLQENTFTYEYVHSVQKTPVQENFVLAPNKMLTLTSTDYQSLGVGLPFLPEEGNLLNDNGIFVLSDLDRHYEKINIAYIPLAKQALICHSKYYDFKDYFSPGTMLEIKVEHYSPVRLIWQISHCERKENLD